MESRTGDTKAAARARQGELCLSRLAAALKRMKSWELVWQEIKRPSPLGFPLLVERLSSRLTN